MAVGRFSISFSQRRGGFFVMTGFIEFFVCPTLKYVDRFKQALMIKNGKRISSKRRSTEDFKVRMVKLFESGQRTVLELQRSGIP